MKTYTAPSGLILKETRFSRLMQRRIHNVLIIGSTYDIFTMEEDGRVEEQVYNEYAALNLSSPPRFIKAGTFAAARSKMEQVRPDLVMVMPGVEPAATLTETAALRAGYPDLPVVLLLPFARKVSQALSKADLSPVDYVFSWLGDMDLIVAIIKLLEDKMNAVNDILDVGVQSVLVVEDSTRFYSAMLPLLFRYLLTQSMNFSTEALNDHEKKLRMRGRPKVLFARTYEEARALFDRYGEHMLGVITDVRYPMDGTMTADAGLRLTDYVKKADPFLPVIITSTETENEQAAVARGALFIDKNSKTMPRQLRAAVRRNFGFGDLVLHDPGTNREIMRIRSLNELQKNVFNIPSPALFYLCGTNGISRWLSSRALFPIADALKRYRFTDMSETPAVRQLIFDAIVKYRRMKNRGVVAIFRPGRFDRYSSFARIGQGSMGGKGRGLAFIDALLKRNPQCEDFHGVQITIPRTVVLCTDIFDTFMETNNLYDIAMNPDADDDRILTAFLAAGLPQEVTDDLTALFRVVESPLAIRSSSLLEDSHYQPFAGVYSTYMVPHADDPAQMLQMVSEAIKGVYASVFFAGSKAYMNATRNLIDEEKMAVIIQEVVGKPYGDYYYPNFSGVGRSINYYPVGDEKADDGVVEVAAGLGKYIVDGGRSLRFSPAQPGKVIQTSTLQTALRDTQTTLCALPLDPDNSGRLSPDDSFNIATIPVAEAAAHGALKYLVSTYDAVDGVLRDNGLGRGRKVVTFANVLNHNVFPLAEASRFMLTVGQKEMGRPVEIEMAATVNPDASHAPRKGVIYWLQMRPIVDRKEMLDDSWLRQPDDALIMRSDTALGHGLTEGVDTVVYIRSDRFDSMLNPQLATQIEQINRQMVEQGRAYVLIGPGRWGSSDPALGIPVTWPQIAAARLIVETSLPGYRIEPSQGTHFFQNLTSFGVGYFTIDRSRGPGFLDEEYLNARQAEYEDGPLRVVRFDTPLTIAINGRKSAGVVLKPGHSLTVKEDNTP